jgi:small GTP-binding protein
MLLDGVTVRLQLWDTGGAERFRSIAPLYYRNADAVLLVYDVSSERSFGALGGWLDDLKQHGPEGVVIALIGNKADRADRVVTTDRAEQFAREKALPLFAETSALTGQ